MVALPGTPPPAGQGGCNLLTVPPEEFVGFAVPVATVVLAAGFAGSAGHQLPVKLPYGQRALFIHRPHAFRIFTAA